VNIFGFDLKVWAVAGHKVALIEAQDYAGRHFNESRGDCAALLLLGCRTRLARRDRADFQRAEVRVASARRCGGHRNHGGA